MAISTKLMEPNLVKNKIKINNNNLTHYLHVLN